jgi:hypothetical protein
MTNGGSPGHGFGCEGCWPAGAEAAWEARAGLDLVAELIDESHFHVTILACRGCAQGFVSVFTETIDWQDGDDPQYWTLLPITAAESADLVQQGDALSDTKLDGLGPGRRSLRLDHPKGAARRSFWSTGLFVGQHD